ncbi:MAG: hypothetical protein M0Q92_13875 [Methanoregula sp.]|jgi:hypothetical protein|nr:hypothetical protein [Methanoregula sp.]
MANISLLKAELERLVKILDTTNDNIFDIFQVFYDYVDIIERQPFIVEMLKNEGDKCDKARDQILSDYNNGVISKDQMHILHQQKVMTNIWSNYGYFHQLYTIKNDPHGDIVSQLPIHSVDCYLPLPVYRKQAHVNDFTALHNKIISFLSKLEIEESGKMLEQKEPEKIDDNLWSYDKENKCLFIGDDKVRISKKRTATKQAFVFDYLVEQKLHKEVPYYEISEKVFNEDVKNYRPTSCTTACNSINEIIRKNTKQKIEDFLLFTHGKDGYVKINSKYKRLAR